MNYLTETERQCCTRHGIQHCALCGSLYRNIAFKGSFVCEDCVDYIKGRTPERR